MRWVILRTMSGERFLCQTDEDLGEAIGERRPVKVTNVYAVSTTAMMQALGPARITTVEYPDLQRQESLPELNVLPTAWYEFPEDRAMEEINQLRESVEQAQRAMADMQRAQQQADSGIVQARMVPTAGPMRGPRTMPPGMGPVLGSLARPPVKG